MDKPEFQTLSREDLNMFRKNQGQEEEESEALRNRQQMRRERVSTPQPISSPPPPPPGRAPDLRPPTSELPKKLKTRPREVPVSKPKQKTKKNPPKMNYARPAHSSVSRRSRRSRRTRRR